MSKSLNLLIIEDSEIDALLIVRTLKKGGFAPKWERVDTEKEMKAALEKQEWDIIISDYSMPDFNGLEALNIFKEYNIDIPFILISGVIEEEFAVDAMVSGAHDYVMKDKLFRLLPSVERALGDAKNRRYQKKTIQALKESEKKYRLLADNSIDAIWKMDLKLVFTYVSPSVKNIMGYTVEEWVGTRLSQYASTKEFFNMAKKALYAIKHYKKIKYLNFEATMLRKDGTEIPVEITGKLLFNKKGLPIGLRGTTRDITERKQAEEALKASEKRFRSVVEEATEIVFITDDSGNFTYVNPAGLASSGYSLDELKKMKYIDLIEPDYKERVRRNYFRQYLRKSALSTIEYPFQTKSGNIKWFNQNARIIIENDKVKGFYVIARDVTERRIAEQALQESEEKYRNLFNEDLTGNFVSTTEGKILLANPAFTKIFGYDSVEEVLKINIRTLYKNPEDRIDIINRLKAKKKLENQELTLIKKDGKEITVIQNIIGQFDDTGNLVQLQGYIFDITERKQAEDVLKENEDRYRQIYQFSPDSIIIHDMDMNILNANNKAVEELGYSKVELLEKTIFELHPENELKHSAQVLDAMKKKEMLMVETRFKRKDGSVFWAEATPCKYTLGGKPIIHVVIRDITERKQAEEALTEEHNLLRTLIDNLPDFIYAKDSKGRYIVCNQAHLRYLKTTTIDKIIGKSVFEIFPQELAAQYYADDQEIIRSGQPIFNKEEQSVNEAGDSVWNLTTKVPLRNRDGNILGLVGIAHDITERKQTEKQLQKSLKEKEILIKEIYHRVKNNLAVVSGLLNMQSTYIKDKEAIAAFQETRDRIYSISAVHSQLYNSEDYSTIDYTQYIKNLVNNIFYSSQISGPVKLHLELDDVILPIDKAIPCGLLLNEIVTNALKHAFPENRKGNLRIIMSSLEDNNCEIIVKDDGIGIPDNLNLEKSKTYGLKLINLLTKQIDRTLEIISEKGTEFRIRLNTEPGQVIR